MGTPGVQLSPWVWSDQDYQGNSIGISLAFNNNSKALGTATLTRDAACVYQHLYFGTGPDGTPNTAPGTFLVPVGTSTVTAQQLKSGGFNTINDVLATQIAAGQ